MNAKQIFYLRIVLIYNYVFLFQRILLTRKENSIQSLLILRGLKLGIGVWIPILENPLLVISMNENFEGELKIKKNKTTIEKDKQNNKKAITNNTNFSPE